MENKKLSVAGVVSIIFAALNALGLIVSTGCSLHLRHKFIEIYADLGAELPHVTQMILNIHWIFWVLTLLVLLAILAAKELITKKWIPLLLNGVFVLVGIAYWAVFSTAMLIPFMKLIQQMENG
jgi:hypothetical protein